MKKIFVSMLLLMTVVGVQAQTANDEFTKEIERTIELSNPTKTFTETLNSQLKPLVAQGMVSSDKIGDIIKEIEQLMVPELKKRIVEIYKQNFTLAELKQMNYYLASPVGQKAVKLTPMIAEESIKVASMPEMQEKLMKLMSSLMQQ